MSIKGIILRGFILLYIRYSTNHVLRLTSNQKPIEITVVSQVQILQKQVRDLMMSGPASLAAISFIKI